MKLRYLFVIVLAASPHAQYGQSDCKRSSMRSPIQSIGANESVQYSSVHRVKKISGKVSYLNGEPILNAIIDVYRVRSFTQNRSPFPSELVKDGSVAKSYSVDKKGRFCLIGLPNGYYILRIGTDQTGFKHLYIKVRKKSSYSSKTIRIELEVGT
jgi:hypothetical protein